MDQIDADFANQKFVKNNLTENPEPPYADFETYVSEIVSMDLINDTMQQIK